MRFEPGADGAVLEATLDWAPEATANVQAASWAPAPPQLDSRRYTQPWSFIILADTQYGMLNGDDDVAREEEMMANLAVEHVNRLKPSFVVVCGDLINEPPTGNVARAARQVRRFKRTMSRIDKSIPLVCCCGNHDVGDLPNRASMELYRRRFGDDYLEFWAHGSRCLVVNSSLMSAQERSRGGDKAEALALATEQDAWLERRLRDHARPMRARGAATSVEWTPPLFVFSHIPPFLFDQNEPKEYFNLEPEVRAPLLARLDAAVAARRSDAKWFAGHFHRNAGGWAGKRVEVVTTSAVGTTLAWKEGATPTELLGLQGFDWSKRRCDAASSGLRCVCVSKRYGARHKFFTLDAVPARIVPGAAEQARWDGAPAAARL